jgi:outer membrane protein TolC
MNIGFSPIFKKNVLVPILFFLTACSYIDYQEKPLDINEVHQKNKQANFNDSEFIAYLKQNNFNKANIPFKSWGIDELLIAQKYFNPALKTADLELKYIESNEKIASLRPLSSLGTKYERGDVGDPSENFFKFDYTFTYETANKRLIRYELAFNETQLALLDKELIHWKLRASLIESLTEYINNQNLIQILKNKIRLQQSIVFMVQKRLNFGLVSKIDLAREKIKFNSIKKELIKHQNLQLSITKNMATLVGFSLEQFNLLAIDIKKTKDKLTSSLTGYFANIDQTKMHSTALLNRIDLRQKLAHYAIAEANLKLEIAKQYPDMTFTPAYIYDFGYNVWGLGIQTLLKTPERNKAYINRATIFRELEASKVENFELEVNNQVEELSLSIQKNKEHELAVKQSLVSKNMLINQLQERFDQGQIDRMELEKEMFALLDIDLELNRANNASIRLGLLAEGVLQDQIFPTSIYYGP